MTALADLVGLPFRTGGRDTRRDGSGIDCLGIVTEGLRVLGIPWQDPWELAEEAFALVDQATITEHDLGMGTSGPRGFEFEALQLTGATP